MNFNLMTLTNWRYVLPGVFAVFLWHADPVELRAADWPPQDHGGADLNLAHGDVIWGLHTGVGQCAIAAGTSVTVAPFDGIVSTGRGGVEIFAQSISVGGVLDASGRGYTGGGGGGGGGAVSSSGPGGYTFPGGNGGSAPYGGTAFDGASGQPGLPSESGMAGSGASGDGPHGGIAGTSNSDGGYGASASNGDTTFDISTWMGSGGAGGSGENGSHYPSGGGSGGGGGAGGRGGGQIRLIASAQCLLLATAQILADGTLGDNGNDCTDDISNLVNRGGDGANMEPEELGLGGRALDGGRAVPGGRGAGGGILLQGSSLEIHPGATVVSRGGRAENTNGGTVKLLGLQGNALPEGSNIAAGRIYLPIPASAKYWNLYY